MVHQDPASEGTLEELRRVVEALPRMPRNIVDDTRHEKVLSYVSAFIAQEDPALYHTMLVDWGILDIFEECLAKAQDYRVSCVALRLLGFLLKHDTVTDSTLGGGDSLNVWQLLEQRYQSTILEFMINNATGEEALTRIMKTGKIAATVSAALKDTSSYVLEAACRFLVAIIENRGIEKTTTHDALMDTLLESISLYSLIHSMISDQTSERNRLAGLEFIWMVTDARSERCTAFLKQSQLFFSYMSLLTDDSRLVRSRSLDIFSILLESTPYPLGILGSDKNSSSMDVDRSEEEALVECYNYLLEHDIRSLMAQETSLKALHVATGILDATVKPLATHKEMHGRGPQFKDIILSIVLWIIQALQEHSKGEQTEWQHIQAVTVIVKGHGQLASLLNSDGFQLLVKTNSKAKPARGVGNRGGTLPKTIVLSALKALQSLALLFPDTVEQSVSINIVLSILFDTKLCADQRVFKACLATLPIVLKTKVRNGHLLDGQLFSSAMTVVMKLLNEPASSSTLLRLILTAIQEFFADDTLGRVLVQENVGRDLAESLEIKLYDKEWDVRDNVVEFIGGLFAAGGPDHGVEWALKHDLLESVFRKLSDEEAYVRAASIHAFETVMRDARGWKGMGTKRLEERFSQQLPELIRDSEAFVRRAVLEAMICLVSERESGTVLMVGTHLFVDATFMYKLTLDDSDWEVRIRACEFLAAVWEHCVALDERADYRARAAKRLKDSATEEEHMAPPNWWFYDIKGDKILIEATLDASRLVRLSSVETLKKMKASIEERLRSGSIVMTEESISNVNPVDRDSTHKRKESNAVDNHPHVAFYRALCKLDFERLDATTSVEQLYQEVLDVERVEHVVMAESEQANDGNNVLDCYA
ncbi:BRCA1-associated ATM activator 1 [Podila minutissima]|uniref:BRCA1-associated ATM activator 1 n=1 Tax=Podila minutissima TaxID=64525 RepID=A0A9P5SEP1_9FUNG|nr:BRCA1-associated ATM activator 1 [Podila minutissima]